MIVQCKVLEVQNDYVVCENTRSLWWLGKETFKMPKDNILKDVEEGDIVHIEVIQHD